MGNEGVSNAELREPRSLTRLQWLATAVGALGTIFGGAFGVYHFFFGHDGGKPAVSGPTAATVDGVTFTPQGLGTSALLTAQVRIVGEQGKPVRIVWTLMDAEHSQPVTAPGFVDRPLATFTPGGPDVESNFSRHVPVPSNTGTDLVFVRVRALAPDGTELDSGDSGRISVGGGPSG